MRIAIAASISDSLLADPVHRVAHVIDPAPFGGAESVVRALCEASIASARDVSAALLGQHDQSIPLGRELAEAGVTVDEIRCGRRRYLAEASALAGVVTRRRRTVVHTHVYHANFVGWRAARRAGIPVVATLHGYTGGSMTNRVYEWLDRQVLRRFDAVICVSNGARDALVHAGADPRRLHVVQNGFAPRRAMSRAAARQVLALPDDAIVAGWVGRLSHEKGADLFVDALAASRNQAVHGVIIGDGEERVRVEQRAAERGVPVRFVGARSDAASLLSAFDLLVLSSRTEGTPMVLLEAMAGRIPVAAFAVGGVPAVVSSSSAWLAPPTDATALGAAIADVVTTPDEARRRADRAHETLVRDFGMERWLQRLERVYDEISDVARRSLQFAATDGRQP